MIRKIILYVLAFSSLFASSFFLHKVVLDDLKMDSRFELFHVYSFYFFFSLIICCLFFFFSNIEKWKNQLGFMYIYALVTKLVFFRIVFKDSIFKIENITKTEGLNLLLPLFLFLFLEVYFVAKILKEK